MSSSSRPSVSSGPIFTDPNKRSTGGRSSARSKESERKGSEGSRPKTSSESGRRSGSKGDDGDDEFEDEVDRPSTSYMTDEQYYGDEGRISLSTVSASALRRMEAEGFSLEDMQASLYGQYGVRASIVDLRRRLYDDSNEKKKKKRTGKTRRDNFNERRQKQAEARDKGIELPEGSVIQVSIHIDALSVHA